MKVTSTAAPKAVRSPKKQPKRKAPPGTKNAAVIRAEAAAMAHSGDGIGGVKNHKLRGYAVLAQEPADKPRL